MGFTLWAHSLGPHTPPIVSHRSSVFFLFFSRSAAAGGDDRQGQLQRGGTRDYRSYIPQGMYVYPFKTPCRGHPAHDSLAQVVAWETLLRMSCYAIVHSWCHRCCLCMTMVCHSATYAHECFPCPAHTPCPSYGAPDLSPSLPRAVSLKKSPIPPLSSCR